MESRAIVRIALMAAVIGVLGMLPGVMLPIAMGVPITAQTLGVMLAGIILGVLAMLRLRLRPEAASMAGGRC